MLSWTLQLTWSSPPGCPVMDPSPLSCINFIRDLLMTVTEEVRCLWNAYLAWQKYFYLISFFKMRYFSAKARNKSFLVASKSTRMTARLLPWCKSGNLSVSLKTVAWALESRLLHSTLPTVLYSKVFSFKDTTFDRQGKDLLPVYVISTNMYGELGSC